MAYYKKYVQAVCFGNYKVWGMKACSKREMAPCGVCGDVFALYALQRLAYRTKRPNSGSGFRVS